jgi:hypothetical protein
MYLNEKGIAKDKMNAIMITVINKEVKLWSIDKLSKEKKFYK